ncbi:MAG: hypothetical protein QW481_07145, partial [Candidatus Methanomethylicia archaeon]
EGYESKGFVFRIYDEDKKIYPSNVNVSLKFTTDGINFNYVVYELSDSDGNVSYYLDPDCSFTAGTQYFKAETSDICYQFAETENYNFDIIGSLRNSIIYPEKGSEILIEYGELINVSALVEDECENKISEATVSLKAIWPNNTQETLTLLSSQNGIYNFTLDLTSKIGGNYSFSVESSKEYYNSNSTLFENWIFLINSPPIAENVSVAPESGGWGEKFSFRVDVYDLQRDTINCSLYVYTGKNDWLLKGSKIIQNGQGTCEINVTNFDCLDINTTQPTRFKFQISDGENVFNTSEILAPSIGRNDVNLTLIRGNNSFVNRTYGSTLFTIRVFDLDRSIYPENVNLSVLATKDNYNYQRIGYVLSNSTGYANFNFAPDCSYNVGIQNWKFEVVDNCYIPLNSSDYITTIYGWLRNNITSPKGEKYLRGEQDVILRGQIKDECGNEISQANATFKVRNVNGATFTCSPTQEEDFGYYNCTIYSQTHSTWPTRGYDVTMESNKTYYNINSTTQQFMQGVRGFFLETRPRIWNPQAIPSQDGGWGETWSFKVRVGDYDFDNLVVRMWLRKAGQDWSLAAANYSVQGEDVEVVFTKSDFTSLDIGNWEVKFNVTDYPNVDSWDKNETLPISFTLVQDDINITLIEGNDTVVNRSIAPLQSNATFSIRIYDTDKNELIGVGVPINAKFYVSNDSSWTSFILDSSVSSIQAGQFVNTTFPTQPRCRYDIGLLRWYAEAGGSGTAYKLTNSTSFYGYFYVTTVTYPLQAQVLAPDNKTYRRAVDSITYIGNVSDDCGGVKGASITFNTEPFTVWGRCLPSAVVDYLNGTYSCTVISASDALLQWYNLTMQASKQYYNDSLTARKIDSFNLATNPEIKDPRTNKAGNIGGWGEVWTFSVDVRDIDRAAYSFEAMNVSLWIDLGNGFELSNSTICSATTCADWTTISFSRTFECGKQGIKRFKFNVSDYWGYKNETSIESFTIEKDDVDIEFVSDPDYINREFSSTGQFVFRILDTDRQAYVTNTSTLAKIWFTTNSSDPNSWDSGRIVNPSNDGYVYYNFDPNCSYSVGIQYWKAGTIEED